MPAWQVVFLINLALGVGIGFGYGLWGHNLAGLSDELKTVQAQVERVERERQACIDGARVGEQQWEGRGIVRATYPQVVLITHEEIAGLYSARTTSFRLDPSVNRAQISVGVAIRFWLRGDETSAPVIVRTEPW